VRLDALFPTIVTKLTIQDARNGVSLHWDQHRCLTVMEDRRAQGFLDEEFLVGTPLQRWKIIGNSMDRNVSFALRACAEGVLVEAG
jgi:DNA (cytosine-5)-methyltransferase 1